MQSLIAGQLYRRVGNSSGKGPEFHGPCPVCGGNDRFHLWPEQGTGTFWCRICGKGGDLVEFYRWKDGLSYRDACALAGVDSKNYAPQTAPSSKKQSASPDFVPSSPESVRQIWAEHALKFADWCHLQLLASVQQLQWLQSRGIDGGLVAKFGLGWNPSDTWRAREAWGLETISNAAGKPKKLWLPAGLVIPQYREGQVARMRIRRPEGEPKYYVVPGSGREPLITNQEALAYVVVESELDAILLDGMVGDLVGTVALGNSTAKPTASLHAILSKSVHLSISLDSDTPRVNPTTGKTESPGAQASRWWLNQYRQADRVPVVGGKDPGDAYQSGVDLRSWVLAGLPPRFTIKQSAAPALKTIAPKTPETVVVPSEDAAENQDVAINHRILTLTDGKEIHITDSRELWQELTDEGVIVFSEYELLRLQEACVGLGDAERAESVRKVVEMKEVFPGAYVRRGEVMV